MVTVIKANGDKELFDEQKVIHSIQRAGIPLGLQEKVLNHIKERLHENIKTSEIYHHIIEFLGQSDIPYARSRYSLKESIMLLGPSGYPFEDFVSEILKHHGFKTAVRQVLLGTCVSHEVDIVAEKDGKKSMIEVKFHNNPGTRTEVQVSLYTKSRFEDIIKRHNFTTAMIVTNTKITSDAIAFAECSGMELMSWSYPEGRSLRDLIEETKLHPVTALTTISASQKATLLNAHIVICKDIYKNNALLDVLHLPREEKRKVLREVAFLCASEKDVEVK